MVDDRIYTLKRRIVFKNYPIEVETAKSRRPVYYLQKNLNDIPNKYADKIGLHYDFDEEGKLYELKTGDFVLKNSKLAGKPRTKRIKGQDLHALTLKDYERSKIINELKDYFLSLLKSKNTIKIDESKPVFIHFKFKCKRDEIEDIDNYSLFYTKTLLDVFQKTLIVKNNKKNEKIKFEKVKNESGFLDDDNVDYVTGFSVSYEEVENPLDKDRRIIVSIYQKRNKEEILFASIDKIIEKATKLATEDCITNNKSLEEEYFKDKYDYYFDLLMEN